MTLDELDARQARQHAIMDDLRVMAKRNEEDWATIYVEHFGKGRFAHYKRRWYAMDEHKQWRECNRCVVQLAVRDRLEAYLLQEAAPLLVELWHRKMTEVNPKGNRSRDAKAYGQADECHHWSKRWLGQTFPRRMMTYIAGQPTTDPKGLSTRQRTELEQRSMPFGSRSDPDRTAPCALRTGSDMVKKGAERTCGWSGCNRCVNFSNACVRV